MRIELTLIPDQINVWLCFGHVAREVPESSMRRTVVLAPGTLFGLVSWQSNALGTLVQRLWVLRARDQPGAQDCQQPASGSEGMLLRVAGGPKVRKTLALIDLIQDQDIDPADVCASYWRRLHMAFALGKDLPLYAREEHRLYRQQIVGRR